MSKEKAEQENLEEYGEEVRVNSLTVLREAGPKVVLNLGVAVLIWLFGNLVFIPISQGIFVREYAVTQIISFVTLVTLAGLLLSVIYQMRRMADAGAGILAYEVGRRGQVSAEEVSHYRTALRGLLYVFVVALAFLFLSANLSVIHPALAGVALIAVVIWAFFTLWRVSRALSAEIERYTRELAERLEKRKG